MDLNYSREERAFRYEVRGWLRDNLAAELRTGRQPGVGGARR
jgi:hypothetical protein